MPAAAVIPAPVAYINDVAVKKLVVDYHLTQGAVRWSVAPEGRWYVSLSRLCGAHALRGVAGACITLAPRGLSLPAFW